MRSRRIELPYGTFTTLLLITVAAAHLLGVPFLAPLLTIFWFIVTVVGVTSLRSGIFGPALCTIQRSSTLFLTFDDGPDPQLTPQVLELLRSKEISATFFLIANKAESYPELVRAIAADGHAIGCHDLHHRWWSNFRTTKRLRKEIGEAVRIIESITQTKVTLYRPPVGLSNPPMHQVCHEMGLTIVGWNRSARDGGNRNRTAISHLAALPVRPGDIVLMHDSAPVGYNGKLFLGSLETLISRIKKERFSTEPLSTATTLESCAKDR